MASRARTCKMEELDRQQAHRNERQREERHDEVNERLHAYNNLGVSMTGVGNGWRYRAGAPRAV